MEENKNALVSSDANFFKNEKEMFTSLDLSSSENKKKLYNSLQKCDLRINDIVGQTIEFSDLFIEEKPITTENETTGEVSTTKKFRTILYGSDGKTYVSSAYGVYNSIKNIVSIFGLPTTESPIKVSISKRPTASGKETLILTLCD